MVLEVQVEHVMDVFYLVSVVLEVEELEQGVETVVVVEMDLMVLMPI
jgi:hypothetical protein